MMMAEVILKARDLFYMSPGHKASVLEDGKLLDFSPQDEFKELVTSDKESSGRQKNNQGAFAVVSLPHLILFDCLNV